MVAVDAGVGAAEAGEAAAAEAATGRRNLDSITRCNCFSRSTASMVLSGRWALGAADDRCGKPAATASKHGLKRRPFDTPHKCAVTGFPQSGKWNSGWQQCVRTAGLRTAVFKPPDNKFDWPAGRWILTRFPCIRKLSVSVVFHMNSPLFCRTFSCYFVQHCTFSMFVALFFVRKRCVHRHV